MFDRFLASYAETARESLAPATLPETLSSLRSLFGELGGATFKGGLYRVHSAQSSSEASALVRDAFPDYRDVHCFGFDWLGRQFAIDLRQEKYSDPEVLLIEPGSGGVFEIGLPVSRFHDQELVDDPDAALAANFYAEWKSLHPEAIGFNDCVGFRVPLFLGGVDDISNLELSDLGVYWSITGGLINATRQMAPGEVIPRIELADLE